MKTNIIVLFVYLYKRKNIGTCKNISIRFIDIINAYIFSTFITN